MNAQELKSRLSDNDIIKIVTTLGSDLIKETDEIIIFTTFACHGGNTPKLYYYKDSKSFYCYTNCGQLDILHIVCENKGYSLNEAINYICTQLGISTLKEGFEDNSIQLIDDWSFIKGYKRKRNKNQEEYKDFYDKKILNIFQDIYTTEWINEGITKEVMKEFDIKYSTLQQKIIIPHYDIENRLMGVRGRALIEEEIDLFGKYSPFQIHKVMYNHPLGQNLYGIHKNRDCIKRVKKAMIVEAEKGVLQAATMFGINNNFTLGLCGNKLTKFQRDILLSLEIDEVIIAVDKQFKTIGDDEYYKWIEHIKDKIINVIAPYFRVYVVWDTEGLLNYKDSPTDKGKDVLLKLMKQKIYIPT